MTFWRGLKNWRGSKFWSWWRGWRGSIRIRRGSKTRCGFKCLAI